jgi:phage portal protein BeeE
MGLLKKAVNAPLTKSVNPVVRGPGYELSRGFSATHTLDYFARNDYENAYSSIRVISQRFAAIEPFTLDKTGKAVSSNVLDRLYTPNNQMSAYDFRLALAVMCLVHNKVYLRVHHRGTQVTAESITGFTFLEGVSEHLIGGQIEYWLPNGQKLGTDEVAVFRSPNPYNLNDGFSPAFAARRWTSLDDLIADYQTGFFNNGGVPAGQFIITAKTTTEFQDIANNIKERHQGAGNNGGVMFAHRPIDPATQKPTDAQVEWVPFSTTNKDMALKDLFEQANKKIDSVYGVPASLRGVNDNNTYASVRVDTLIFNENTLDPFALNIWQKFTHELTRMTGGLGVAISYRLETPLLADEEKVKAEAKNIDAKTVRELTEAGYTLDSAIAYVKTGDITVLKQLPKEDKKPEVLDRDEARDTPDQPVDPSQRLSGKEAPVPKAKALSPEDRADYEAQLEAVVTERMTAQINAAQDLVTSKAVTPDQPVDPAEDELLARQMLAVLTQLVAYQGAIEHVTNARLIFEAGIDTENILPFEMTGAQQAQYAAYMEKVATGYNAETAERIRNVIKVGRDQGLSAGEMKKQLKGLIDDYRIKRLVVSEVNHAGNGASLWSMQNISRETGAKVRKHYEHSGAGDTPCPLCQYMISLEPVDVFDEYVGLGDTLSLNDGTTYTEGFMALDGARDPHPFGHCRQVFEVVR